jgi:hypothetical protein
VRGTSGVGVRNHWPESATRAIITPVVRSFMLSTIILSHVLPGATRLL